MRIETREQLVDYIASHKGSDYSEIHFYEIICGTIYHKIYPTQNMHIGRPLHSDGESGEFLYFIAKYGLDQTSLGDRNIGHHHNDNWWFTTRESAEEYLMPRHLKVRKILVDKGINMSAFDNPIYYMLENGNKINAIKLVRAVTGCDLLSSKLYVEHVGETYR